jgi:hypothetical protein
MLKSVPPVILNNTPFAPPIESSSKGESIALRAASTALFSPDQYPIHIKADHALLITDFTSAKSTLIKPA